MSTRLHALLAKLTRMRVDVMLPLPTFAQLQASIATLGAAFVTGQRDTDVREHKRRRRALEQTYGEVLPAFMVWLVNTLGIDGQTTFVDIGSGVGQVLVYVAALTGADAIGYEIDAALVATARANLDAVRGELQRRQLTMGATFTAVADATRPLALPFGTPLRVLVFINNLVFPDELTNVMVAAQMHARRPGTQLVLTKPLLWTGRAAHADTELFRRFVMPPTVLETPGNVVSWSGVSLQPVLYTLRERDDDVHYWERWHRVYATVLRARRTNIGERPQ